VTFEINFSSGNWPDILWRCCTAHICHEGDPPCAVLATNINRKLLIGALSFARGYLKVTQIAAQDYSPNNGLLSRDSSGAQLFWVSVP